MVNGETEITLPDISRAEAGRQHPARGSSRWAAGPPAGLLVQHVPGATTPGTREPGRTTTTCTSPLRPAGGGHPARRAGHGVRRAAGGPEPRAPADRTRHRFRNGPRAEHPPTLGAQAGDAVGCAERTYRSRVTSFSRFHRGARTRFCAPARSHRRTPP
ncbi:hypothetical protein QJS66_08650 [Kocuria rhizophila]|nr:hypothetical protein QJS66_08650 [Kocuria rhizophila]